MTIAASVAKARRELKKIHDSEYAYMSNEHFKVGKLRKFIEANVNEKSKTDIYYHRENKRVKNELNDILAWDKSQLNKPKYAITGVSHEN